MPINEPLILSEEQVLSLLTPDDAFEVVREAFSAAARGAAINFPVIREKLPGRIFGIKSAVSVEHGLLGFKAGGSFPGDSAGQSVHQSSVSLVDYETGQISAIISGNAITRLRTAAACALSIACSARDDALRLGVIGAGAQAASHIRAALKVRPFESVAIWSRSSTRASAVADKIREQVACDVAADLRSMVENSDVLITLTPSTATLVDDAWVRPGTHLACMGADTAGKQEVDSLLVARAHVLTDEVDQALTIGECQSAFRLGLIARDHIRGTLGGVLEGHVSARGSSDDITLFDGTGVALQDLFAARFVVDRMKSISN
ncbi:ornithine cyclodeaminase family protein [Pseudochelatococcus sp. B33]